jgi:FkbM family methyltransferase
MSDRYSVMLKDLDREVTLLFHYDPTYIADRNTRAAAEIGCEPDVTRLMMRALKPGDIAVDVGANIGFFTVLMGKLVGPTGKVHAFEPHPENVRRLHRNLVLNDLHNVIVYENAAWEMERELTLYTSADSGEHSLRVPSMSTGSRTVEGVRVAHALPEGAKPRLIKIDVEGAEVSALKGIEPLFTTCSPLIVAEMNEQALDRFGQTSRSVRKIVEKWSYDTWVMSPLGLMPHLIPANVSVVDVPPNQMVLFAAVDQVAKIWPRYSVEEHHGPRRPVLPAASGSESPHPLADVGADAGRAKSGTHG